MRTYKSLNLGKDSILHGRSNKRSNLVFLFGFNFLVDGKNLHHIPRKSQIKFLSQTNFVDETKNFIHKIIQISQKRKQNHAISRKGTKIYSKTFPQNSRCWLTFSLNEYNKIIIISYCDEVYIAHTYTEHFKYVRSR